MNNNHGPRNLKYYEKPTATKLTRQEAITKLQAYADRGDEGAKELLARVFVDVPADNSDANN
ncbi:MAG TPA: hypothetical protein VF123_07860 [Candidatus Sulfotelmatobacter sp.]